MILIIAPFPSEANSRDGMVQRIASIDELLRGHPRIYLDISFRRYFQCKYRKSGDIEIHEMNFFIHFLKINRLVRKSKFLYLHSVYSALKIFPFLLKKNIILDAHGVVPEELSMEGSWFLSLILNFIEKITVKNCLILVSVTERMRSHFIYKYGRDSSRDQVFPILPKFDAMSDLGESQIQGGRDRNSVIYAGGLQIWQNVDLMVKAVSKKPDINFTFLTNEALELKNKLKINSLLNFTCQSVSPDLVKYFYLSHEYGFILRDEILINEVACPTKLIEYLHWGVIPVVLSPHIGDFSDKNLSYVTLSELIEGDLPDEDAKSVMRLRNQRSLDELLRAAHKSGLLLKKVLD